MHRLVVALTSILVLVGVAFVAAYLLILEPSLDPAAGVAPARSVGYLSAYLTPSTGQQLHLANLMSRLPGFTDRDQLPTQIDELVQRVATDAGFDYRADMKPWLGSQVAIAIEPGQGSSTSATGSPLLIAAVRDPNAAAVAIHDAAARGHATATSTSYQGVTQTTVTRTGTGPLVIAIVNGFLLASPDEASVHAAIDAAQGRVEALRDAADFRAAMAALPADRLAAAFVSLQATAQAAGQTAQLPGYSWAALALVVQDDGLQLVGRLPYHPPTSPAASGSPAFFDEASPLTGWMPPETEAEVVLYGAGAGFATVTQELSGVPGGQDLASSLAQLRGIAALGLGIDIDRDLLPLFTRDAAIAVQDLTAASPRAELIVRPADPSAAPSTIGRIVDALKSRGATAGTSTVGSVEVSTLTVPQAGSVAFVVRDGVIVLALSAQDAAAAVQAHASGSSLASSAAYQKAFALAGGRGGNELYLDGARAVTLLNGLLNLPADARDILSHVSALALSLPAHDQVIDIRATVTVR